MSAQTVIHPSIASMKKEAEDLFIENSKKLILQEDYALGEGYCSFKQIDAMMTHDILLRNDCELNRLIRIEIEEYEDMPSEEQECSYDNVKNSSCNVYELWLSKGNVGTIGDFLRITLK